MVQGKMWCIISMYLEGNIDKKYCSSGFQHSLTQRLYGPVAMLLFVISIFFSSTYWYKLYCIGFWVYCFCRNNFYSIRKVGSSTVGPFFEKEFHYIRRGNGNKFSFWKKWKRKCLSSQHEIPIFENEQFFLQELHHMHI